MFAARALWGSRDAQLKALDELDMAMTSMQVVSEDEFVGEEEAVYKLRPAEVPFRLMELEDGAAQARAELNENLR